MKTTAMAPTFSLPAGFPESSRVWVYQANRTLSDDECDQIKHKIHTFVQQWQAHKVALNATGALYFNRFICLFADESNVGASGCSIDSSMRFIKALEAEYGLLLTDRMQLAYLQEGELRSIKLQDLAHAMTKGIIHADSIVFNNLIATIGDMTHQWMIPLKDSWHMRFA